MDSKTVNYIKFASENKTPANAYSVRSVAKTTVSALFLTACHLVNTESSFYMPKEPFAQVVSKSGL